MLPGQLFDRLSSNRQRRCTHPCTQQRHRSSRAGVNLNVQECEQVPHACNGYPISDSIGTTR